MTRILLGETPTPDGAQAAAFFERWHAGWSAEALVQIAMIRVKDNVTKHVTLPLDVMHEQLRDGDLSELCEQSDDMWNLYHAVGVLKAVPEKKHRGGRNNVLYCPGVWIDLDIKGGSFASLEQELALVDELGIKPTCLVETGTGGLHAYWKTAERLGPEEAQGLGNMVWARAEQVSGLEIDRLTNPDRVMRLPGSIRWPKAVSEPVTLARLRTVDGPTTTAAEIRAVAGEAWEAIAETRRATARKVANMRSEAAASLLNGGSNRFQVLQLIAQAEEIFAETYTWEQILLPLGWTVLDTDWEGRTVWQRPEGKDGRKSATTDWPGSPHTMSLFSTAHETGLGALVEAGVPLTKYRVFIHLVWNDDEAGYLRTWLGANQA